MSCLLKKVSLFCFLSLLATAFSFAAGPNGKAIEFSEPRNERGLTNVQGIMPGRSSLDRIEAELNGPLKSILKGNSLEGMIMPAPQLGPQPILQTREPDASIHRRDQMYQTPDDLYSIKSIEDIYKAQELTADGRKMKNLRPMERWVIQTLSSGQGTNNAPAQSSVGSVLSENNYGQPADLNPNSGNNLMKQELRKVFGLDKEPVSRDRNQGASELFGLGAAPKITQAEFQNREAFMQNLDPNYVPAPSGASQSRSAFSTRYVNSSFYDPPKVAPAASAPAASSYPSAASGQSDLWKTSFQKPAPVATPTPPAPPVSPFLNSPGHRF